MRRLWITVLALALCGTAPGRDSSPAEVLRAQQEALGARLARNDFGRPLVIESEEGDEDISGDVFAVVDHPFSALSESMKTPAQWCEVVMMVINIKRCQPTEAGVTLNVGRKADQPIQDTYLLKFAHRVVADAADYMQVRMGAADGPFGTHDYRIVLEAVPSGAERSFVHLRYSYGTGMAARLAFQGYLSTLGRNKVGFSVVGHDGDGHPEYVRGTRGAIERTTMRYYLAISTYLDSLATPSDQRVDARLRSWFAATERYARQLHEMDEGEYLSMKRRELRSAAG